MAASMAASQNKVKGRKFKPKGAISPAPCDLAPHGRPITDQQLIFLSTEKQDWTQALPVSDSSWTNQAWHQLNSFTPFASACHPTCIWTWMCWNPVFPIWALYICALFFLVVLFISVFFVFFFFFLPTFRCAWLHSFWQAKFDREFLEFLVSDF